MSLFGFSPKVTAIVAGIFTLLQGLGWSIIGILALLVHSCSIYISEGVTPQFYRLYLVYFYSGECGTAEIEIKTDNGTVIVTWPEHGVNAAYLTYAWVMVYLILSLFWVLAALILIIATVSDVRGVRGVLLRSPWLMLTSIFIILDVVTSVYYAIDISHTGNLEQLLAFVGLVLEPDTISSSSTSSIFGHLTTEPSILAVVIFSRVILGWVLNLVFLTYVARDAKNGESPPPAAIPEPRKPYQEYLHKLSTIGPVPDVKWDPYQRKRSDLPVLKPLEVPSPPNERKRKQSDYQQYLFYAKKSSQINYFDDIKSEPPTPAPDAQLTTTEVWRVAVPQAESGDDLNSSETKYPAVMAPAPDYESDSSTDSRRLPTSSTGRKSIERSDERNETRY